MKKLLLVAALSVATTSVFAQAKNFEGPSAALTVSTVGANTNYKSSDADGSFGFDAGKTTLVSGVDFSYATAIDSNWLIGVGITYDLNKTKSGTFTFDDTPSGGDSGSLSLTTKNHYSLYVQPTYAVNNSTALFAKLGYHKLKGVIDGVSNGDAASVSSNFNGIGYGVGVKTFINKNLFVQAEAQLVDYKKKSFTEDGMTESYKIKSTAGIVSVGYKF